ncbi:MAG: roadblock/LC7 domain-containing protein [Luteimonas sp.]|nr:roadblock/LC7 domain-containing protein [Luteimonas sp.]
MAEPAIHTNPAHAAPLGEALQRFAANVPGVGVAVLASVDGFAMAQYPVDSARSERLAAMTSSMLALAGAIGRELAIGALEVLMVEADEGKVLMLSIPTADKPLLLMASCANRSVTGNVLWAARECGRGIQQELGAPRTRVP